MAFELSSSERVALAGRLLRVVLSALVVLAVVLAAAVTFGWTLTAAPFFGLTPDPAGGLPF
jgi:hypothetical protein